MLPRSRIRRLGRRRRVARAGRVVRARRIARLDCVGRLDRGGGVGRPYARDSRGGRVALVVVLLGAATALPCASARGASWARPVLGSVTRDYDVHGSPFGAGLHRGVDLAAPPGTAVGAPCSGRVVVAGRVGASGRVVTVACGRWHATVLPLASVTVHRGAHVRAGLLVGTASRSAVHAGIHLGVRRASDRFGYVDPMRFLPRGHPWTPIAPPAGPVRRGRRAPARPPAPARRVAPALRLAPAPGVASTARSGAVARHVAPWPVWAGAALMLVGAATGGVFRRRARRARRTATRLSPRTSTPAG